MTAFTALGDIVNITARLASAAVAGEILVNESRRAIAAGWTRASLERRSLDLKGKAQATNVYVLATGAAPTA